MPRSALEDFGWEESWRNKPLSLPGSCWVYRPRRSQKFGRNRVAHGFTRCSLANWKPAFCVVSQVKVMSQVKTSTKRGRVCCFDVSHSFASDSRLYPHQTGAVLLSVAFQ